MGRKLQEQDYVNKKYNRLTVKSLTYKIVGTTKRAFFVCECECNNIKEILAGHVVNGHTQSCGCLQKERVAECFLTHGQTHIRLYSTWENMIQRCHNSNNLRYKDWGGRGIKVCDEWREFEPFRDWAFKNGYSDKLSIDRINNDGNYEPSNCRWVDNITQMRNTRTPCTNTSGVKGVTFYRRTGKWIAQIGVNKKMIRLGYYNTIEDAAYARAQGELKYWQ